MPKLLDVDEFNRLLRYEPETGLFFWRITRTRAVAGRQAGYAHPDGYIVIGINYEIYLAHRLAWAFMTGEWPAHEVDHENNVRHDNRWSNLRAATDGQQCYNQQGHIDRKSRFKGVQWHPRDKRWRAQIAAGGVKRQLGSFHAEEDAAFIYEMWAELLHGEFANAGRKPAT